jgi:hypothetical protein
MKQTFQLLAALFNAVANLLHLSSRTFIAKTDEEQLDYHTITISTR